MYHPQLLQVLQPRKQLNGKSPYQSVVKAAVVIHFDELVEVYLVEVEH